MFDLFTFAERELAKPGYAPSKRAVKNQSGRASRKQLRTAAVLQAVGGTKSTTAAIHAPSDQKLCRVVDTAEVGWLPDGRPRREPRVGLKFGV